MPLKLKESWRRFVIEFVKIHYEIPGLLFLFAFVVFFYLSLMAPSSDMIEIQKFMSFTIGMLMPLPLSLASNFLVLKEVEKETIDYLITRQSPEKIWLYRFMGFLILSGGGTFLMVSIANQIFGQILPVVMTVTIIVPTFLLSGLMAVATGVSGNAYLGAGAGIVFWLYNFLNRETLTTRLNFNETVYYPFLEWIIFKNRPYLITSLVPNRLAITILSILLFVISFFLYKHNLRFLSRLK